MNRLTRRADFLAASGGTKITGKAFVLQARSRDDQGPPRFGFTVSKKIGTAVERNRVRRRLRELVRRSATGAFEAGHDYVLIGRRAALSLGFEDLTVELSGALRRIEKGQRRGALPGSRPADETSQ